MNYPCPMIRDLIPLCHDGVCSGESRAAVQTHLEQCADCRAYYDALKRSDRLEASAYDEDGERQKAASLRAVRRRIGSRNAALLAAIALVLAAACFGLLRYLDRTTVPVLCDDGGVTVSREGDDLVARLSRRQWRGVQIQRAEIVPEGGGRPESVLFFRFQVSRLEALFPRDGFSSSVVLAYGGKGADDIAAVYYAPAEDAGAMDAQELAALAEDAVLLWRAADGPAH